MNTRQIWWLAAAVLLASCAKTPEPAATQAAQPAAEPVRSLAEPVVGVADPDALFTDKDPKLNRNKQAAYHIVKELLECNHWQDAHMWLTDRYIQHNPMAASGLAGVVEFFTNTLKREPTMPCPEKLQKTQVVAVVASGDYVTVVFPREYPIPNRPEGSTETYTTTWFDMWRFVDGKADEHWDPAQLAAR